MTYSGDGLRLFGRSALAVPVALRALWRGRRSARRSLRALLAVPVAAASSALTVVAAYLVVINVLAYPFRPYLGFHGSRDNIWASRYDTSWGGPTLVGAWTTHTALVLLLGVPVVAILIRGLASVQYRLLATERRSRVTDPARPSQVIDPVRRSRVIDPAPGPVAPRPAPAAPLPLRRALSSVAAVALFVAFSLASHRAGISPNLLWAPHDPVSGIALAVTVAPLVGLLVLTRTGWWRAPAQPAR
ncbi:MAG TPA: hypothetical protein VF054_12895 [Micromonosporaceae bacterium]